MLPATLHLRRAAPRIVLLALVATIALAAARWQPSPVPSALRVHVSPNVVSVVAHDFAFEIAESIPAGLTRFELRNRGSMPHHLSIVRLDSGKTAADGLAALITAGHGVRPAWMHAVGGPNAVMPNELSNATFVIEPGHYMAYCEVPGPDPARHYMRGMVKGFTVTPPSKPAALPVADIAVNLVDYDFVFSKPLTVGHHVLAFTNSATQPHMVAVRRLPVGYPAGQAAKELVAWAMNPQGKSGPGAAFGGITEIAPGQAITIERDFVPGMYLLICFSVDATDGKPHFMHGMQKEITIR